MKWNWIALCLLLFPLAPRYCHRAPTSSGGVMELEATVKTEYVKVLAVAPDNVHWAAGATYETTVFKGQKLVSALEMGIEQPELSFSSDGKKLRGSGLEATISSKKVVASGMLESYGQQKSVTNVYALGKGDTVAAFVRALPSKTLDKTPRTLPPDRLCVVVASTGEEVQVLDENFSFAEHLRMAVHGAWLVTAHEQLRVWNWRTGELVFEAPLLEGIPGHRLAFSTDGKLLATATYHTGDITIWDTDAWKLLWQGPLVAEGVSQVAFVPQTHQLVLGGRTAGMSWWSLDEQGTPTQVGEGIAGEVEDFAYSLDGKRLYVAGADETRIYRVH